LIAVSAVNAIREHKFVKKNINQPEED